MIEVNIHVVALVKWRCSVWRFLYMKKNCQEHVQKLVKRATHQENATWQLNWKEAIRTNQYGKLNKIYHRVYNVFL